MIDQIRLHVEAGSGGDGCESYDRRRDKKTIPHGGDGGRGGDVIFRADINTTSFSNLSFKRYLKASSGEHGQSNRRRGRNGENLTVPVPCGTRIADRERGFVIRELIKNGEEVVVVTGSRGGSGNQGGKERSLGEKGKVLDLELSLFIPAEVFLIGMPNSGKSKLLNFLTRAHVKEEHYPFATKEPQVGVWKIHDYESLTLCEIPSLYEASHEGRGMGTRFLRHLEGAKLVLYVLDPLSQFAGSLAKGLSILRGQVESFRADYLAKPWAVLVNKMDIPEAQGKARAERFSPGVPVFYVSAATGEGIENLKQFMREQCVKS